ncbi:MAG: hypothetical protein J7639_03290 [Paenibacillaceae bacterium]|nr:hypothetical protein [Paenibacillaceae bacterium]
MERKIGLDMQLPEGKQPGFYAQIVKGLADKTTLFDRDKELLVVNDERECEAALEVLQHYKVPADRLELLLLPEGAQLYGLFADYGFASRTERHYLYEHLVWPFALVVPDRAASAEPKQALLQMEEHLIASYNKGNGQTALVTDREFTELMERIARAYGCSVATLA